MRISILQKIFFFRLTSVGMHEFRGLCHSRDTFSFRNKHFLIAREIYFYAQICMFMESVDSGLKTRVTVYFLARNTKCLTPRCRKFLSNLCVHGIWKFRVQTCFAIHFSTRNNNNCLTSTQKKIFVCRILVFSVQNRTHNQLFNQR